MGQVMEEAGRTLAASPLASSAVLAAPLLLKTASDAHKAAVVGDTVNLRWGLSSDVNLVESAFWSQGASDGQVGTGHFVRR